MEKLKISQSINSTIYGMLLDMESKELEKTN
jgi:hypothetical protein